MYSYLLRISNTPWVGFGCCQVITFLCSQRNLSYSYQCTCLFQNVLANPWVVGMKLKDLEKDAGKQEPRIQVGGSTVRLQYNVKSRDTEKYSIAEVCYTGIQGTPHVHTRTPAYTMIYILYQNARLSIIIMQHGFICGMPM